MRRLWTVVPHVRHLPADTLAALTLLFIGCTLTACSAAVGPEHWTGGASAEQLARDEYECHRDAKVSREYVDISLKLYEKCMAAKGYTRR